jgi:hypothetical protein
MDSILNTFGEDKQEEKEIISCDGKITISSKRNKTEKYGLKHCTLVYS